MRVDGIQFDLLCEQSVCNVWRKRAFTTLCHSYREVDASVEKPQVTASLQIFRERVDFMIENTVPQNVQYSQKIEQLISANRLVTLRMIILTLYFTNLTLHLHTYIHIYMCAHNSNMLQDAADQRETQAILSLIKEEERRNEDIKSQYRKTASLASSIPKGPVLLDLLTGDEGEAVTSSAEEHSFSREQVQEQEQVFVDLRFF